MKNLPVKGVPCSLLPPQDGSILPPFEDENFELIYHLAE